MLDSVAIAREVGIARCLPLAPGWLKLSRNADPCADASSGLKKLCSEPHAALAPNQRLLIEYKPFEPAFYHTDIADWGMSAQLCRTAGPQACVLVDTGHHYQSQNIEQIVAWLLHLRLLGGFHFNDRRYADDDLTLGSIDPYQVFRIFHELHCSQSKEPNGGAAFMIDQSHNLKGKIEAMVQTVVTAQELWLKARLSIANSSRRCSNRCDLVAAEELFRGAFWRDVRPCWLYGVSLAACAADPLTALREDGYVERITRDRASRQSTVGSYA